MTVVTFCDNHGWKRAAATVSFKVYPPGHRPIHMLLQRSIEEVAPLRMDLCRECLSVLQSFTQEPS